MVETILKRLLDRDYPDYVCGTKDNPTLGFEIDDTKIEIYHLKLLDQFSVGFYTHNYAFDKRVSFEDDIEKAQAFLNFKKLAQRGFDKVVSQVYVKVMGIEVDPEEQPKTFDDAQTQIVNNNVEE